MLGELDKKQIEALLESEVVGRLGCHSQGVTYVVPTSYVYSEGCLYAHSGLGEKIEMMRDNPEVCLQVDHINNLANWQSVIVWGTYEELEGDAAEAARLLLVQRLTPLIPQGEQHSLHPWSEHGGSPEHILHRASRHGVVYRIRITRQSGRSENWNDAATILRPETIVPTPL